MKILRTFYIHVYTHEYTQIYSHEYTLTIYTHEYTQKMIFIFFFNLILSKRPSFSKHLLGKRRTSTCDVIVKKKSHNLKKNAKLHKHISIVKNVLLIKFSYPNICKLFCQNNNHHNKNQWNKL